MFKATPSLVVFVVIALGYSLGKLNIRGFELGPTGGVLLVGLLFGLAASAGLRAFLPLLVVGLAGRLEVIGLGERFVWLSSTPALTVVQEAAKSSMTALGSAGTYAFANVMLTVAGTIIMTL